MQKSRFIERTKKFFLNSLVVLIKTYQIFISPIFPPCCRFTPTCSTYAIEVIYKYGVLKGLFFTSKRILCCNPFCKGGKNPVP